MAQIQAILDQNPSWPVSLEQIDASKLNFPDNTFTHSLAIFVFAGLGDDVSAASHTVRTIQVGGTGLIAVWNSMPWHIALENAHQVTRGDEPMGPFLSRSWYKKEKLT
jgi:ubiquinone/menaquinone biosynthesis C-methylase UbiE